MRSYTRPPARDISFRDKKFNEVTSKLQFDRTIFFSTDTLYNSAVVETELCVVNIPAKALSGNGESLRFTFIGLLYPNADLKTVKLKLNSTTLFDVVLTWDTVTVYNAYCITGEIFSHGDFNGSQWGNLHMSALGHGFPVLDSILSAGESLNEASTLTLTGTSLTANNVSFSMGKVEISPAPR